MPNWIHSFSVHFSNGVPVVSTSDPTGPPPFCCRALATTTASWSTSVSQSRSVVTFHCDFLAFS